MKVLPLTRIPVVLSLLAPYTLTFGQGVRQLLEGNSSPRQTLAIKDLPEAYKAVRIQSGSPDTVSTMTQLFAFGMGANPAAAMLQMGDVSWTDGSTVQLDGSPFLVTYKLDLPPKAISKMMVPGGASGSDSSAPTLKLVLVRVSAVSSLSMEPSITKESLLHAMEPILEGPADVIPAPAAQAVGAPRSASAQTEALNNVKQCALGTMMYVADYDDVYPWPQSTRAVHEVVRPYLKNDNIWNSLNPKGGQILFNMALGGVSSQDIPSPAETVLYYDSMAWPDGRRVVAYADGHAKLIKETDWQVLKKTLGLKLKKTAKKPLPASLGLVKER